MKLKPIGIACLIAIVLCRNEMITLFCMVTFVVCFVIWLLEQIANKGY